MKSLLYMEDMQRKQMLLRLNVAQSIGFTPDTNLLSNDIYILDIQNYAWVIAIPANQSSEYNILQFAIGKRGEAFQDCTTKLSKMSGSIEQDFRFASKN
ncbi:9347_t:CDS:2 [Gigaspora margarita]|uniref:9347_t:CDS:1 n=1 Tax=Gigaspora margarita TaxID=4874 RepID=A0ABM8W1C4_GIGMA|nr:9347_t:CDS:2 [Gigaspora margarita]